MLHKLRKALCFSVNSHGCEEIKLEGKTAENIIFLSYRPVWFRFIIVCNICNLKEDKVKALTGAIICISSYLARFSLSTHTHHCHFFATWHYQMCLRMKAFKCTSVLKEKAFSPSWKKHLALRLMWKKSICVLKVWLNESCEITVPICQSYRFSFHHARWKAFECDSVQSNVFTHANLS